MPQAPQFAGPSQEAIAAQLGKLRATANELKLRASDLAQRKSQLSEQRRLLGANQSPAALDKQIADAQHDLVAAGIQLETVNEQIEELQTQRDMARAFSLQGPQAPQPPQPPQPPQALQGPPGIATTAAPFFFPEMQIARERERMIGIGAIIVLAPLALALSRRIWHRGGRVQVADLENSPRLQRIEQAVEAIAVEVERIGEAQRFTTKLLSERQPEVAQRLAAQPRREPGTITPH